MFDKIKTEFFLLNSCSNMWSLVEILSLDLIWQRAPPSRAERKRKRLQSERNPLHARRARQTYCAGLRDRALAGPRNGPCAPGGGREGVGDHDITEFDITESDVTFFQEFDITESDITEKGNFYNGIRYNGICYNMKLEIGITKFVTVESDITGKWKLI